MPNPSTTEMARLHEEHAAKMLGGTRHRGSGNQWQAQTDGDTPHDEPFAFRIECKSTKGQGLAVTLSMIEKAIDQGQGDIPVIPLRWYANDKLTEVAADWMAVKDVDLSEIVSYARQAALLERALGGDVSVSRVLQFLERRGQLEGENTRLRGELEAAMRSLEEATAAIAELTAVDPPQVRIVPGTEKAGHMVPGYVPRLPWTVISSVTTVGGGRVNSGLRYNAEGHQSTFEVSAKGIRVDRSGTNKPVLVVDDVRVREGALYVDGRLRVRTSQADPALNVG